MSNNSMNSIKLVAAIAAAVFIIAFLLLMFAGDYRFMASFFMAVLIALLTGIVLYLGLGTSAGSSEMWSITSGDGDAKAAGADEAAAAEAGSMGASARSSAADATDAAAARKASAEAEAEATKAAETARKAEDVRQANADAEAERRAESEAEAARKASAEAEAASKAAADAEAARKAAVDAEAEAARKAAADADAARDAEAARNEANVTPAAMSAPTGSADLGEDYDGDGVREGIHEGTRPAGLDGPRGGQADDLKQIKGIGAKMEQLCNSLGFWHFDQIAAWSRDEVAWVDANLKGFKGRVTRDEWVSQAGILASGGTTEFAKRVEDGGVY